MRGRHPPAAYAPPSALEAALDRVGDRWSLLIVDALLEGPRRFGELRDALPSIAPNILNASPAPPRARADPDSCRRPYSDPTAPDGVRPQPGDGRDLALGAPPPRRLGGAARRPRRAAAPRSLRDAPRGPLVLPGLRALAVSDAEISGRRRDRALL